MSNGSKVRDRSEIPVADTWRLEDLFADENAWEEKFAQAKEAVEAMPALQAALEATPENILTALRQVDALGLAIDRLYSYARMKRDEDSRQAGPQALADRAQSLAVRAGAATAFLRPALLEMPEELLASCMKDARFADFDRTLFDVLRSRPHTLSAELEALLAEAGEIGSAPANIFTMLSEADLSFPSIEGEDGKPADVTEGRFITLLSSKNGQVRQAAYKAVLETYGKFGNTIAATYAGSVKADAFDARAHRFATAMEASMFASEIPTPVYDALLTAIDERLPALNRYLSLKKSALGVEPLHLWDLYVDTSADFDLKLSYDEAFDLVMKALAPLGEAYGRTLREAKESRWVDVYENAGKSHGAYSWGSYGVHPYVLMNFEGTVDSASTLAHELGHAMHSFLSEQAQPYAKAGYTLFAAEVASTVNEILLSSYLLAQYPQKEAQQSLLGTLLEHFRTTVFRQTLFAAFEKETHAMQERGEALTKDALCELYYGINKRFYGESCVVDEQVRYEWMRIPHFYRAFYVYQYATGFSAAVSIARRILRDGQPAVDGYMKFLSAGGALPPLDALRLAGVDMETPQPVREALDWFEEILTQFEGVC